jgi:DNA-directed RNA polymerase subunit RPC12/RpoP
MPKTARNRDGRPRWPSDERPFRCGHCGRLVEPLPWGGKHRNHCPACLYSRHVDERVSGDRASRCGGLMAPVGVFTRRTGEYVLLHRCLRCGAERFNRIAADDNFALIEGLPRVSPRTAAAPVPPDPRAE